MALEISNSKVIIDDIKARKIAKQLNIKITSTIGVIMKAKLGGIIPSIKLIIEDIKALTLGYRKKLNYELI